MEIYHIEEGLGRGHPKPLLLMTDLANLLSEIDPRVQAHWDGNRDREHVLTRVPREYRIGLYFSASLAQASPLRVGQQSLAVARASREGQSKS